jgi:hypothetical protein
MSVHTLDTAFQYPATDVKKISDSRETINYTIRTLSTLYLPVLAEELNSLQTELNATDTQALRTITQVPAALQSNAIQELIGAVEKIQGDSQTVGQTEALDAIYAEIKLLINDAILKTTALSTDLNNNLTNLKAVTLSDNGFRIRELDALIADRAAGLPDEQSVIKELVEDEKKLGEAIKVIEAVSTFDLIKEVLLTAEQLATLQLPDPRIALVQAGIKAAVKVLGVVGDAVKYDNLITARRELQKRLDDRRSNLARLDKEIKTFQERKNQLMEAQTVQASIEVYSHEIATLVDSINTFLKNTRYSASDKLETVVKTFIEQSTAYSNHLNELRKAWRS